MTDMPNKIGIDVSSKRLGWVVWRTTPSRRGRSWHRHVGAHGTIVLGDREPLAVRLIAAEKAMEQLIARYRPDAVAIEGPAFETRGVLNLVQQSRVSGVVQLVVGKAGLPVIEIAPTRAKFALTGKGKADKDAMIAACPKRARNPFDEHTADAVGVARAAFDPTVPPPRPKKERKKVKLQKVSPSPAIQVQTVIEKIPRRTTRKRVA